MLDYGGRSQGQVGRQTWVMTWHLRGRGLAIRSASNPISWEERQLPSQTVCFLTQPTVTEETLQVKLSSLILFAHKNHFNVNIYPEKTFIKLQMLDAK